MQRRTLFILTGILCAAMFSFAFIAAPYSCEWGATAYFLTGLGSLVILFFTPVILGTETSFVRDALLGFVIAFVALFIWVAGLFVANVRILCRLF